MLQWIGMDSDLDLRDPYREPNPVTRMAYRRQVWLEIYLPLLVGGFLVVGGAVVLWRAGIGSGGSWADIALVMLLLPVLAAGLLAVGVLVGLAWAVSQVIGWLPANARAAQEFAARAEIKVRRAADGLIKPLLVPPAAGAALSAGLRRLLSIFAAPTDRERDD
jgi:hypothetical protein